MNIGLYFGSFNPIHTGHLIIASHILNEQKLAEIWFVISPQNPLKKPGSLLNEHDRLNLVLKATEGEMRLKASSVEFKLPKPSYTIDTLAYLEEKYPHHSFEVIMGSDSFENLTKWKNYELLLKKYKILIYERPGHAFKNEHDAGIELVKAPLLEISSTHVRELIRQGKSIRYLVPDAVKEEIEINNYYSTKLKNPAKN